MTIASRIESFLNRTNQRVREHARRYRRCYATIAGALFTAGLVASFWALELKWQQMDWRWLMINLLAGAPLAIALNAVGLAISAGIVGASLSFKVAFRTCCLAICSNLLPIPAGSVIHASSLAARGGSAVQSGIIVFVGNGLSLAMIMTLVGAILAPGIPAAGLPALGLGIVGLIAGSTFVFARTTPRTTLAFVAIRMLRTLTMVLRIQLSFLIVGVAVSILDATLFSGAVILGTTFVVFPAGLGVSEGLAAILALTTTIASGAAFLATALNRLVTLAFAGIFLLISTPAEADQQTNG